MFPENKRQRRWPRINKGFKLKAMQTQQYTTLLEGTSRRRCVTKCKLSWVHLHMFRSAFGMYRFVRVLRCCSSRNSSVCIIIDLICWCHIFIARSVVCFGKVSGGVRVILTLDVVLINHFAKEVEVSLLKENTIYLRSVPIEKGKRLENQITGWASWVTWTNDCQKLKYFL